MEQVPVDPAKALYEAILSALFALRDMLIDVYGWLPVDWPAWVKIAVIVAGVVISGQVIIAFGGTTIRMILSAPILAFKRWRLLKKSPFGKKKWATLRQLRKANMLRNGGLFLGQWRGRFRRADLYQHGEGHIMTIAAPGGGKSTAVLIPSLLTSQSGSFVVTDPKGELTAITRRHRESCSRVVYLNPFHKDFENQSGLEYPDSGFNPFVMIDNDENSRAQADSFARFLMVTDRKESGSYFQDEGAELLSLFIAWMVRHEVSENQNLEYLYDLVRRQPRDILRWMDYVNDPLLEAEALRFREMAKKAPAQWQGAISKAHLATKRYIPTTPLARHTSKNGFDPRVLKSEDLTVYVLLPSQHMKTAAPWLNMVMGLMGEAVGRAGTARPVTFLLDELPALGYLPDLRSQMRQHRGAGLRMWLFSQSASALYDPEMYGSAGYKDMAAICSTKQFFNIDEPDLAKDVSSLIGQTSSLNPNMSGNAGHFGAGTVGVPMMRPEELIELRASEQVIVRKGMPIQARLIPYYKRAKWRRMTDANPYL